MTLRQSDKAPATQTTTPACKHLRVQIVAREEDAEFVECKECGEIFESSEFKDMSIEERATTDEP
jgi:Zn ribbon nucleic-acid-binding protein